MKRSLLLLVVAVFAALTISASADEIVNDDPHLQVGPCTAGFPNCSGDPNYFSSQLSEIQLYDQGAPNGKGSGQPLGPIALVLVLPSTFTDAMPTSVTLSSGSGQLGGANFLGGHWNTTTGVVSSTPMTTGDIVQYIGFNDSGDGSDNVSNFNKAESSIGFPTGSYNAWVYSLTNTGMSGKTANKTLTIDFNSLLPEGTIILAYSCIQADISGSHCKNGGTGFVPWTTAGFVDTPPPPPMPEPTSLALLGSGLGGLALLRRRK